jgi:transcriptional accessory protein Tex/SPT6
MELKGWVHVPELTDRFVKDPREVVKGGDVMNPGAQQALSRW